MVAAADVIRYVLSSGGLVVMFAFAAIWIALAPHSRRARIATLVIAFFFLAMSSYALQQLIGRAIVGSLTMLTAADFDRTRKTAIVILGAGSRDVRDWDGRVYSLPDEDAAARVLEATRVYKIADPAFVISSGGHPHPQRRTAPTGETMRDALVALGVPYSKIVVESVSKTTRDEAVLIAPLLKEHGAEQVVLVTSETHMRRSLGAFRAVGVTAIPAIAYEFQRDAPIFEMLVPTKDGLSAASENAHELLGIVYYWLRGWYK